MSPVSRNLQCGITLYSNAKNNTNLELEQGAWDRCCIISIINILLSLLLLLLLLSFLSIKTVFHDFFAVFTFGTLQNVLHRK